MSANEGSGQSARKRQRLHDTNNRRSSSRSSSSSSDICTEAISTSTNHQIGMSSSGASEPQTKGTSKLVGLQLEAIFYPKFDNENRTTSDIRRRMLDRVETSKGYLEVSLKHSGSLLLWSGGTRYYSKNSVNNKFTRVGELLLRQHFARAWKSDNTDIDLTEARYTECSQVVESQRLTLSFELVTSVLGQHGDTPKRDFLILTAIADRSNGGRFFDTLELVEFAQRYRLPHNDVWLFQTPLSCKGMFDLYDKSRETALADGTIASLSSLCDGSHIQSIYPHVVFQGNILEGIVIRYVPYPCRARDTLPDGDSNKSANDASVILQQKISDSARASEEIIRLVPPTRKSSFEESQQRSTTTSILFHNIRSLPNSTRGEGSAEFDQAMRNILDEDRKRSDRYRQMNLTKEKRNSEGACFLDEINELRDCKKRMDGESYALIALIDRLNQLQIPVEYKLYEEEAFVNGESRTRRICSVHVKHDTSFQKFSRHMTVGDMPLYRGFVIRLVYDNDDSSENFDSRSESDNGGTYLTTRNDDMEEAIMLKMKFLPYMVRTFGIRNGLSILEKSGPVAYDRYTMNLLIAWEVSQDAIEKWQPFFHCWGLYAYDLFSGKEEETDGTSTKQDQSLHTPPIGPETYLEHLRDFSNLFYGGIKNVAEKDSAVDPMIRECLQGLVVIVGITKETSTHATNELCSRLGSRRSMDIGTITEHDMLSALMQGSGGLVCSAVIEDGTKTLRALNKKYKTSMYIIFVGCSDEDVSTSLDSNSKALKKRIGMLKGWKKVHCHSKHEWPDLSKIEEYSEAFHNTIREIQATTEHDHRPGLLVFFPAIPGSGKSSLSQAATAENLLTETDQRSIKVCVGDTIEGKYWPLVKRERMSSPSSVYIADKNAPPTIWPTIADICVTTSAIPLPIFPDERAVKTSALMLESGKQIVFPFTFPYLAVCMQRVLNRPKSSHPGKLDASCELSCMVVVKFYCMYRNIPSEQLFERCRRDMNMAGEYFPSETVRVPFFAKNVSLELPQELEEVIKNAIRLQIDIESSKVPNEAEKMESMEQSLRRELATYGAELAGITASEKESQTSFLAQLSKQVCALENLEVNSRRPKYSNTSFAFIKIVSIDIDRCDVCDILRAMASEDTRLSSFLAKKGILEDCQKNEAIYTQGNEGTIVKNTHVTMAHCSQLSQMDLRANFDTMIGKDLQLKVTACIYGDNNAALTVDLPSHTDGELPIPLPAPRNEFPHITIWFGSESTAADSNNLPDLLSVKRAQVSEPKRVFLATGKLRYWVEGVDSST